MVEQSLGRSGGRSVGRSVVGLFSGLRTGCRMGCGDLVGSGDGIGCGGTMGGSDPVGGGDPTRCGGPLGRGGLMGLRRLRRSQGLRRSTGCGDPMGSGETMVSGDPMGFSNPVDSARRRGLGAWNRWGGPWWTRGSVSSTNFGPRSTRVADTSQKGVIAGGPHGGSMAQGPSCSASGATRRSPHRAGKRAAAKAVRARCHAEASVRRHPGQGRHVQEARKGSAERLKATHPADPDPRPMMGVPRQLQTQGCEAPVPGYTTTRRSRAQGGTITVLGRQGQTAQQDRTGRRVPAGRPRAQTDGP